MNETTNVKTEIDRIEVRWEDVKGCTFRLHGYDGQRK